MADVHIHASDYAKQLKKIDGTFELIGIDAPYFYETFKAELNNQVKLVDPTQNPPRASALAFLAQESVVRPAHELVPSYLKLAEAEENWLKENPDHKGDEWVEKV